MNRIQGHQATQMLIVRDIMEERDDIVAQRLSTNKRSTLYQGVLPLIEGF